MEHPDPAGWPDRLKSSPREVRRVCSTRTLIDDSFIPRIDDTNALRAGGTGRILGFSVKAASTLGTFLRSFRWGHVRQLDRVSRELLARAWAAGAGPGSGALTIDLDSTMCETYGLAKQGGTRFTHTGVRGYHPLLAVAAGTGDVLMARLRGGNANSGRSAGHFLRETIGRVRGAGARGSSPCAPTQASMRMPWWPCAARPAWRFSITIRQQRGVRRLIEAIPEDAWAPISYWIDGGADVAKTTYLPFKSEPDAQPVRLIVRRVHPPRAASWRCSRCTTTTPSSPIDAAGR